MNGIGASLFVSVLLATCGGCASSTPEPDRPEPGSITFETFETADADHSGKLTRDEATALPYVSRHFGEIDADSDSVLSWNETRNYLIAGPVRPLKELPTRRRPERDGAY